MRSNHLGTLKAVAVRHRESRGAELDGRASPVAMQLHRSPRQALQRRQVQAAFGAVVQRQIQSMEEGMTRIGLLTGEIKRAQGWNGSSSTDSERSDDEEPAIPRRAKEEFDSLKQRLAGLKWSLKPGEEGHCYTEVIRHIVNPESGAGPDDLFGEDKILPAQVEKTVYYDIHCPLVDLIHEFDHVLQQEAHFESKGHYLYTTWDAVGWGGHEFGEARKGELPTEEEVAFSNRHVLNKPDWTPLSRSSNDVAEYHNYMREFLRYCDWGASASEKREIAARVASHRDAAEKLITRIKGVEQGVDDDELDASENATAAFVAACEAIEPFGELRQRYEARGGPALEG